MRAIFRRPDRRQNHTPSVSNFPEPLRQQILSGDLVLPRQKVLPRAVIGNADLKWPIPEDHSELMEIWILKKRFYEIATECATEAGLIVLNNGGDGIMFLANQFDHIGSTNWTLSIKTFRESLISHFGQTGVRMGVSLGPVVVGMTDPDEPDSFKALGPEVDLAIRLCRQAEHNQILAATRAWYALKEALLGWSSKPAHYKIRGFDRVIPCMHLECHAFEELIGQEAA